MLSRRAFLVAAGAAAGITACASRVNAIASGAPAARRRLDRIGIQLYAVRGEMQRDMAATFQRLAQIGYRDVEFAGYFGHAPARIRAELQRAGLAGVSTHGE